MSEGAIDEWVEEGWDENKREGEGVAGGFERRIEEGWREEGREGA